MKTSTCLYLVHFLFAGVFALCVLSKAWIGCFIFFNLFLLCGICSVMLGVKEYIDEAIRKGPKR